MTPLAHEIAARIRREGPLSVAAFMELCLAHEEHGYYMSRDPLGRSGDFTTSPEISQMFGELIGLWCVDMWSKLGSPERFVLAELGPGRGTLMQDALRAAAIVPAFIGAANICFVETSPVLKKEQQKRVPGASWHRTAENLPDGPLILIANEFFDALPIRQFERTPAGWEEICVGLAPDATDGAPAFAFSHKAAPDAEDLLPEAVHTAPVGAIAETCPLGLTIMESLADRLQQTPGAALIIDYGHAVSAPGDTFQALRAHKFADPLQQPGEADLTAHVDFAALQRAAAPLDTYGPVTQGAFLKALGIDVRAEKLKQKASPAQAKAIDLALTRLTDRETMGSLFKVMAVASPGLPAPAGI
ncbi:MAG: SAM-dependent methyltransferase [Parvibaculaceae bacterium]